MKKERRTKGWMDLVAIVAVIGLGYLAIAFTMGTLKPIGAVVSGSMEPELSRGDLVFLRKVAPAELRVGDVAQVEIPRAFQERFGLPPNTLHRIVDIQQTGTNVQFITKGDANANIDPIPVAPESVGGVVIGSVPRVGHLFLFLNSPQGRVFALVMAVSVVGYILYVAVSDNWRNVVVAAQAGAGTLPPEAAERARQIGLEPQLDLPGEAGLAAAQPPGVRAPAPGVPSFASPDLRLVAAASDERLGDIESGIHETRDALQTFSLAVAEYGTHLQSHTATVQAMATASLSLVEAVERQNAVLERLEANLDAARATEQAQRARSGRGTDVEASVDDRRAKASVDKAPRRRTARRRPAPGTTDFRTALRIVSARRTPPRSGRRDA